MTDGRRAALLAALTLIGFACALLLLTLLLRCAAGDEAPVTPSVVPEGRSPYTGPAARSPRPGAAAGPLRPAPGSSALPIAPRVIRALPQGKVAFQVPAEQRQRPAGKCAHGLVKSALI